MHCGDIMSWFCGTQKWYIDETNHSKRLRMYEDTSINMVVGHFLGTIIIVTMVMNDVICQKRTMNTTRTHQPLRSLFGVL